MEPAETAFRATCDPLRGTPYRAIKMLGEGGMGAVWQAEDQQSGSLVAVKVLHERLVDDVESLERFRTEAEVAALLDHPNIVRVHELRMPPAVERPYFVMEELHGETIAQRLRRVGPLPVDQAVAITMQALNGLAAAHSLGVVHRDIKPGNILLCDDAGQLAVKIIDFGIAKLLPRDSRAPQLTAHSFCTREGTFLGTALYASPEQARGESVDRRTDLYAMGNVLYNMLTARSPYGKLRDTHALLRVQETTMPEPPSKLARTPIPPELDELVMAALAKRAEERFASAEQFSEALEGIAARLRAPVGWMATHVFDADALEEQSESRSPPRPSGRPAKRPRTRRSTRPLGFVLLAFAMGTIVSVILMLVWKALS